MFKSSTITPYPFIREKLELPSHVQWFYGCLSGNELRMCTNMDFDLRVFGASVSLSRLVSSFDYCSVLLVRCLL